MKRLTTHLAVALTALAVTFAAGATSAHAAASASTGQTPAGFHSGFAQVDDVRLHYLRGGQGSPVVLLHGFPQTWAEWQDQMEPLARDHTVIAVDLRGTGRSSIPPGGYDTATMARDVRGLLAQLGLARGVQVVGHDSGLWVAYAYGAQYPDEVSRMAVMDAPIPDGTLYDFPAIEPRDLPSEWHFGLFQEPLAETLITDNETPFVRGFIGQFLAVKRAFAPRDYAYYGHLLKRPGRLRAWLSMYRQLRTDATQNARFRRAGRLRMPILAIGGERALGTHVARQWRRYASDVTGRVLKGSGHWVTEERPDNLTRMLRGFLR